jgi:hypothetical protein
MWLDSFLASPPTTSTELEQLFRFSTDFAAGEGFGFLTRRQAFPQEHLVAISAHFAVDLHHTDPRQPREMRAKQISLQLDLDAALLVPALEARFGPGREVVREGVHGTEYGTFYLMRRDQAATLTWERERPDWAAPPVVVDAREHLLTVLLDQLITQTLIVPVCAALAPLAADAGAVIHDYTREHGSRGQYGGIVFKPGLEVAKLKAAFRWIDPVVGTSHDTHMSMWYAMPIATAKQQPWRVQISGWDVEAQLDSWPRGEGDADLECIDNGRSRMYLLDKTVTLVRAISFEVPVPRVW